MRTLSVNMIYSSRPGYSTFTSAMLYSVHHARGMDTIPCGHVKRSTQCETKPSAQTMQQVQVVNAIVFEAIDVYQTEA